MIKACLSLRLSLRLSLSHISSALTLLIVLCPASAAWAQDDRSRAEQRELEGMRKLLLNAPLIDGHNDVPWQARSRFNNAIRGFDFTDTTTHEPSMHTDLNRLADSGLGGQFWSVYIPTRMGGPGAVRATLEQIDVVHRLIAKYPQRLQLALTADDVERARRAGRLASLIGMEGGHSIENSLGVLRQLYRAGARYMTLTHSANTDWADSATDQPEHNGLSNFGLEVVREMNRIGMLVDLSHVSPETMHDALDTTKAPVIFSHSSAFALTQHPRNVPDDVLRRVAKNQGLVMVTFVPSFVSENVRRYSEEAQRQNQLARRKHGETLEGSDFLRAVRADMEAWRAQNPAPTSTLKDVADHVDHIKAVAGIASVGIGVDYDGISTVPRGLEDVTTYPSLFLELRARGYTDKELRAIAGGNVLRVLRAAEKVAAELVDEPASDLLYRSGSNN